MVQVANDKLKRWRIKLDEFHHNIIYKNVYLIYQITFVPSTKQKLTDKLSREEEENFFKLYAPKVQEANVSEISNTTQKNHLDHLVIDISIVDNVFNCGRNQLIIRSVFHSTIKPKILRKFRN